MVKVTKNIDYETKRQKAIVQELGCKFIRIDLDKEDFDLKVLFWACSFITRRIARSEKIV